MISMKKLLAGLSIVLAFGLTPTQASAQCDGCVVGAIGTATTAITGAITITNALLANASATLSAAIKGNADTITTATQKSAQIIADTTAKTANQVKRDEQYDRFSHPDECATIAVTQAFGDVTTNTGGVGVGGAGLGKGGGQARRTAGNATSDMKNALDVANGVVAAPPPELQANQAAKGACSSYAANSARARECVNAGFSTSLSTGLPDADVRAESLMDGPQKNSNLGTGMNRRLTLNPNSEELTAVDAFMRNIDTPIQLRELRKSEASSEAGRQYLAFRDAYDARMSLAMKPARTMVLSRVADPRTIPQIKTMLKSPVVSKFLTKYLTTNAPNWASQGVSADELINIEVLRRYSNDDWQIAVAAMAPEARAEEALINAAFQNTLLWRLTQSVEANSVVQSQAVASAVRAEMTSQLNALHRGATSR